MNTETNKLVDFTLAVHAQVQSAKIILRLGAECRGQFQKENGQGQIVIK